MMEEIIRSRVEGLTGEIRFLGRRRENLEIQLVRKGEGVVGVFSTGTREIQIEKEFLASIDMGAEKTDIVIVVSIKIESLCQYLGVQKTQTWAYHPS